MDPGERVNRVTGDKNMATLTCTDGTVVQISAETEAELREAFGPKQTLRHGDYGYYQGHKGDPCVVCEDGDGDLKIANTWGLCSKIALSKRDHQKFDRRGNIFDVLKK